MSLSEPLPSLNSVPAWLSGSSLLSTPCELSCPLRTFPKPSCAHVSQSLARPHYACRAAAPRDPVWPQHVGDLMGMDDGDDKDGDVEDDEDEDDEEAL